MPAFIGRLHPPMCAKSSPTAPRLRARIVGRCRALGRVAGRGDADRATLRRLTASSTGHERPGDLG